MCFSCCSEARTNAVQDTEDLGEHDQPTLQLHQSEPWVQGPAAAELCIGTISINLRHAAGMKTVVKNPGELGLGNQIEQLCTTVASPQSVRK